MNNDPCRLSSLGNRPCVQLGVPVVYWGVASVKEKWGNRGAPDPHSECMAPDGLLKEPTCLRTARPPRCSLSGSLAGDMTGRAWRWLEAEDGSPAARLEGTWAVRLSVCYSRLPVTTQNILIVSRVWSPNRNGPPTSAGSASQQLAEASQGGEPSIVSSFHRALSPQLREQQQLGVLLSQAFSSKGIWHPTHIPDQGSNPRPFHWKCRVLATGPPGKSLQDPLLLPSCHLI